MEKALKGMDTETGARMRDNQRSLGKKARRHRGTLFFSIFYPYFTHSSNLRHTHPSTHHLHASYQAKHDQKRQKTHHGVVLNASCLE